MVAYLNALQKLWTGRCTVYVQQQVINEENGRSEFAELETLSDEPCRISYKSIPSTSPGSEAAAVTQVIKLFISKAADIPEGSKLLITQQGKTETYVSAGKAAVYSGHQEITMGLKEEWA